MGDLGDRAGYTEEADGLILHPLRSRPATTGPPARPDAREIELTIDGMTCAACAVRIEKKLSKISDVTAAVNYATATARVTAPSTVSVQTLTAAIEAAGYSARDTSGPETGELAAGRDTAYLRRRLIVALIFFVPLTDLSLLLSLVPADRFPGWRWVLVACAAPVALWAAWPFHRAALKNARHGAASMDTLVSLGIIAACGWSAYAMFALDRAPSAEGVWSQLTHSSGGGIYLEVAASVTTFLLAGRLYEARARRIAGAAMRELAAAGAKDVCVLETDGTERQIPAGRLRPGDMFVVRPGETIAADGEVLFGQTAVDRSMMTGESVPADACEGDRVVGGTIALTGRLVVRAVKVGRDTQLAHLIRLVEQAQAEKAAIQRLADRICGVFVPMVLAFAVLTLAGWLLAGSPAGHAFSAALAVLIIACPCALGLATPAALVAASGRGAQLGIFIKGYQALELSRSVDTVVLDKTGTVTTGRMSLAGVETVAGTERAELLRYAGAVEQASEHAVAAAITAAAQAEAGPLPPAERFRALPGLGAAGAVGGHDVVLGRAALFAERSLTVPDRLAVRCRGWERDGCTTVLAGWDGLVRGAIAVADSVKPSAAGRRRRTARPRPAPGPADRRQRGHRPGRRRRHGNRRGHRRDAARRQGRRDQGSAGPGTLRGHGRGRRQRRSRAGRGRSGAGPRLRHGRRDLRRRPDPATRRPGRRRGRGPARARHVPHHPAQPRLGVLLQPRGPAAGRARLPEPGLRLGRDDVVVGFRGLEQLAARPVPGPGRAAQPPGWRPSAGPSRLIRPEAPSY